MAIVAQSKRLASEAKIVLQRAGFGVWDLTASTHIPYFPYVKNEVWAFCVFDGFGYRQEDLRITNGYVDDAEVEKLLKSAKP